ncbi:MAG: cell division protein ZapA [Clostridiales bacterium]|nr:cell division protein ZapA [Clostridiales bacterium]
MSKNYTEVLIDGVVYTLGGAEEEEYLRRVAAYLNDKIASIRRQDGFGRMNQDYRQLMIQLNVADDYFKQQERANMLEEQKLDLEKDTYSLKHELVTTQLKLENLQRELEFERRKVADLENSMESYREMAQIQKAWTAAAEKTGEPSDAAVPQPAQSAGSSVRPRRKSGRRNGTAAQKAAGSQISAGAQAEESRQLSLDESVMRTTPETGKAETQPDGQGVSEET